MDNKSIAGKVTDCFKRGVFLLNENRSLTKKQNHIGQMRGQISAKKLLNGSLFLFSHQIVLKPRIAFVMRHIKLFFVGALMLPMLAMTAVDAIELVTKSLLDDKVELKIPADFDIMSEEMMKLKYPSERRPSIVYTNEAASINVALNLTENRASQEAIEPYLDNLLQTFKNMYPSAEWTGSGIEVIDGRKVGYMKLITPAIDTEIYNCIFFTDLDGKLLLCTFNCVRDSKEEWQPIADEIMQSLKVK